MKPGLLSKLSFLIAVMTLLTACQKNISGNIDTTGTVVLNFNAVVDASPLDFNRTYHNAFNETYTVKTFRFYVSKIELLNTAGNNKNVTNDYFLVDAADPASVSISLKCLTNQYNAIAFTIGVDSIRNVSGAQTGALDPANGMFWTWNSGYIMAKFEGTSPLSNQPDNRFEYHIGGFKGADNVVERIQLDFPGSQVLNVAEQKTSRIDISANANTWFNGETQIHIAADPVCVTAGPLAVSIAANYAHMFTVADVSN